MSRTEAKRRFTVEDHIRATEGVECRKDAEVIDETPMAYKDTVCPRMVNDINHFGAFRHYFSSLSQLYVPDQLGRLRTSSDDPRWFQRWSNACPSSGICPMEK